MNSCDQNYEEQRHSVAVAMLPGATALGGATPRSLDPDKPGKGKDDDAMSFKVHMQFGEGESLGAEGALHNADHRAVEEQGRLSAESTVTAVT